MTLADATSVLAAPEIDAALDVGTAEMTIAAGEVLFVQGDDTDAGYQVVSGQIEIDVVEDSIGLVPLARLGPGEWFGLVGVLAESVRSATARALEDTTLRRVPMATVLDVCRSHPIARDAFASVAERRQPALRRALAELFGNPEPELVVSLLAEVQLLRLDGGEVLFHEGDEADGLYVVLEGRVSVTSAADDGTAMLVAELGRMEPVGEAGVLAGMPRNASVRAIRDSELGFLSAAAVDHVLRRSPGAAMPLLRELADRLGTPTGRVRDYRTLALLPLDESIDVRRFADEFAAGFGGSVRVLDDRAFDDALGQGAARSAVWRAGHLAGTSWLAQQEAEHDLVLYVASTQSDEWTGRCIRQADRIVRIGRASASPALSQVERMWADEETFAARAVELVLLRDSGLSGRNTAAWLDPRPGVRHHHLRKHNRDDMGRLVRLIRGRASTLVLSGGGASGYAHVGLIKALRALDVPIDAVAGTSAGATVAVGTAMGFDPEDLRQLCRDIFVTSGLTRAFTAPMVAMLDTHKADALLREKAQNLQMEDLSIPCFTVSSNLTLGRAEFHERGPAWRAIRASMSLPAILPPVLADGEVLVDGGLFDNLPVEPMQLRHRGRTIACDVSAADDLVVDAGMESIPRGTTLLMNRLLPFRDNPQLPLIGEIITRSIIAGAVESSRRSHQLADLVVVPTLPSISMLDFEAAEAFIDIGYRHAMQVLPPFLEQHPIDGPITETVAQLD